MQLLLYDGSFEGWLTAIFEVYEYKFADVSIKKEDAAQVSAFGNIHKVHTDNAKAARVWKGLRQKISANAASQLYKSFLSEIDGMENVLLRYVQYVFRS